MYACVFFGGKEWRLMKDPLCSSSAAWKTGLLIFSVRFQFMKDLTSLAHTPCLSSRLLLFARVYLSPDIRSVTEIHFTTVTPAALNPPRAAPSSKWRADSESFALVKVCLCFINVFQVLWGNARRPQKMFRLPPSAHFRTFFRIISNGWTSYVW